MKISRTVMRVVCSVSALHMLILEAAGSHATNWPHNYAKVNYMRAASSKDNKYEERRLIRHKHKHTKHHLPHYFSYHRNTLLLPAIPALIGKFTWIDNSRIFCSPAQVLVRQCFGFSLLATDLLCQTLGRHGLTSV